VSPGGQARFMVSCASETFQAEIVRITGGGPRPEGEAEAFSYEEVPASCAGTYPGRRHRVLSGSYGSVEGLAVPVGGGITLATWLWPTLPRAGRYQGLVVLSGGAGHCRCGLLLDPDGRLTLRYPRGDAGHGELRLGVALTERQWCLAVGAIDPERGRSWVACRPWGRRGWSGPASHIEGQDAVSLSAPMDVVLLAASGRGPEDPGPSMSPVEGAYNGKLEAPLVMGSFMGQAQAMDLATQGPHMARDRGSIWAGDLDRLQREEGRLCPPGLPGPGQLQLHNSPMLRMTGHCWNGRALDWRICPEDYGAIAFHDDDLTDAGWPVGFEWEVPEGTRSGVYAARLSCPAGEDLVPFYVTPALGRGSAPLAVLVPTFTYTAYSNFAHVDPRRHGAGPTPAPRAGGVEAYLACHRELGLSLYQRHRDGSGISHASWRRPMLDMRPDHRLPSRGNAGRELSGDLYLFDWLEAEALAYDVLTDGEVHAQGLEALRPYRAVVTGGHPEYVSGAILDALEIYVEEGGHLVYLGGNGFYWVTTVDPAQPHVLEVRRHRSGSRTWTGDPGEQHHPWTGEPGGHWRDRGRAPQALAGVGFCAQGGGPGAGYVRTAGSMDPRASFIFEGLDPGEVIGDFGLKQGGAAGDELDRADTELGTPAGTLVLATSGGSHDDTYQHAIEEVEEMNGSEGGRSCRYVRADMTYWEGPGGGSVFSVGSICWSASLAHNGYRNNVATVTRNVLARAGCLPEGSGGLGA
jgi:N,N-dimethylformamidase